MSIFALSLFVLVLANTGIMHSNMQLNLLREKILECERVQKELMSGYEKQTARLLNEVF